MPKKLSQQEAIERIKLAHGNEYEYPGFVYYNTRTIIDIVCRIHGIFKQTFDAHAYNKTGCPECYGNEIITTESFIAKAKEIHGDKYDYSLVEYLDAHVKVKIICNLHGVFDQKPNHHTASKAGCPFCSNRVLNTKFFIEKANIVHENKYDYSKTQYADYNTHVEIVCPTHGSFFTRPKVHLEGRGGCIQCVIDSRMLPLSEFIERAKEQHNNEYDYSLVPQDYNNSQSKVKIICKYHGTFEQAATKHLSGQGCPNCNTYVSEPETKWLDSLSIPAECRQRTIMIGDKKLKVDAFNPETNTIYEFYGDYWHGNLNVFKPELINTRTAPHKTMQELYDETISRESLIKNAGYNIVSVWESDWKDGI